MKKIAYFGGTFDPVHKGHLTIGRSLVKLFGLDRFFFLPAFHAPHKPDRPPTSGYHRYAMLCLATCDEQNISVSTLELDKREKRYTIDTLAEIKALHPGSKVFFVMGADSWTDIRTWHDWENLLLSHNHIVVTRPGYEIGFSHVTAGVRERIVDLRNGSTDSAQLTHANPRIYVTDIALIDVSATEIRQDIATDDILDNSDAVPAEVAKYIEKYELYN